MMQFLDNIGLHKSTERIYLLTEYVAMLRYAIAG